MAAQPIARLAGAVFGQIIDQLMKGGAMVHVRQMRDLMRDQRGADKIRCHGKTPAIADAPLRCATAPAAARIAHTDRATGQPRTRRHLLRQLGKLLMCIGLHPPPNPWSDALLGAANRQYCAARG